MENRKGYVKWGIIVVVALLIVVGAVVIGRQFSYGKEWADYDRVYQTEKGAAIFMNYSQSSYYAIYRDEQVYLPAELVITEVDDRFYLGTDDVLMYTLPKETVEVSPGQKSYSIGGQVTENSSPVCIEENGAVYVTAAFVERLVDVEILFYDEPERVLILPGSRAETRAAAGRKAQVRVQAGRRSPILAELKAGDTVYVLSRHGDWQRVRTTDGFIGYVPMAMLENPVSDAFVSEFVHPDYTGAGAEINGPVRMVWHQVFVREANQVLEEYLESAEGLNVISPTWYALADNFGGITSLAERWYVDKAHELGLAVWGLVNDFDTKVDKYALLSDTTSRRTLISNLIAAAQEVGLDGINIDFELIDSETGVHFIQFIRELSVECRREGLVLSVDNYSLVGGRPWYDVAEQSVMADFVIMMGYDEHWAGGAAGSTASIGFTETTISLALNKVPAEKLIHGIPFYTRVWGDENGKNVSSTAAGMAAAKELLEKNGASLKWLEKEGQFFGEYVSEGIRYRIWLEDTTSLKLKLDLIEANGLAGVACWKLGLEDKAVWPLIADCLD